VDFPLPPILVVLAAAVAAPLVGELTRRWGLPIVVLELLAGVAIGPQGLGLAGPLEGPIPFLALYGMAFLFFLAGLEVDLSAIRGRPLALSIAGWVGALGLAIAAALVLRTAGLAQAWGIVAIALATTALGVLVPILRDTEAIHAPFGRFVMAAGAVGELGPILVMAVALTTTHTALHQTTFTVSFVVIVLGVGAALARGAKLPGVLGVLQRTMTQSGQLPVRLALLLLAVLVALAELLGLDLALGALAAGLLVGLATHDARSHVIRHKLDAIGFGFLVPVFFIASGMALDVDAIFRSEAGLLLVGAFLAALLVTRLPYVLMLGRTLPGREAVAAGFYSATTLSLIVALTEIAVVRGLMSKAEAAPLVGAGIVSVILFPIIALALVGQHRASHAALHDRDRL